MGETHFEGYIDIEAQMDKIRQKNIMKKVPDTKTNFNS